MTSDTLTAELARERTVSIFGNGADYRNWQWNNCDRCVKRPTCALEEIIASASVLDGLISQEIATRLGVPADGDPRWYCRERVTTGPAPLLQGDAVPLPGFSDVPVADDGKGKPWTA